ncbi:MAG: UDP-N-acetylmuramoyl-L-alanyl-D-glutamate--2,6-diaminopimelate ligase [bacterium]|nr:UDP-N-acetylmuramoyl-L-alanyl-D-glutamate--2,6-diaminopimelate ligase [bacterium]
MSKNFANLLDASDAQIRSGADTQILDICYDSRQARTGSLFVALRGETSDGHQFIEQALSSGAVALLVEEAPAELPPEVAWATVPDTRAALPGLAERFFDHPARSLTLVGVTGTNGKTSTARMIESVLNTSGRRAGSMGTISVRYPGCETMAQLTTPESLDLQRTFADMRAAGVEIVALEVSSHSLAQGRVRGLRFEVGVYTHLSQDHLDFHGDMESYADAKALLFTPEYLAGTAVLNAADPHSMRFAELAQTAGRPVISFAREGQTKTDIQTTREEVKLDGSRVRLQTPEGERELVLPLPGDFQIDNALAAACATRALGLSWDEIEAGIAACPPVPGRLERVANCRPVVLVDYAHTPDALDNVLSRIRPLLEDRLITVFGCGGDRDRSKRVIMARAACASSHYVIATSDNPRTEDPDAILRDVAEGLSGPHVVIRDRRDAIRRAIGLARDQDVVVIAGKGHEDYQILGTEKVPFDDRVEARRALRERGSLK